MGKKVNTEIYIGSSQTLGYIQSLISPSVTPSLLLLQVLFANIASPDSLTSILLVSLFRLLSECSMFQSCFSGLGNTTFLICATLVYGRVKWIQILSCPCVSSTSPAVDMHHSLKSEGRGGVRWCRRRRR